MTAARVVGIDIGGTFTDGVITGGGGAMQVIKQQTTPEDRSQGVMAVLNDAARAGEMTIADFLQNTERIVLGSTIGTNLIVKQTSLNTGVITTRGHGDATSIMRGALGKSAGVAATDLVQPQTLTKPAPLVPRDLLIEVDERITASGAVLVRLDEEQVRAATGELVERGVDAIAICFLWSVQNPVHELAAAAIVKSEAPGVYVSCSHDVAPQIGEYERFTATIVNSFLGPYTESYIDRVASELGDQGYRGVLLHQNCTGGVFTSADAKKFPLRLVGSGPSSGCAASAFLAAQLDMPNVVVLDIGGTSCDVGLIVDGVPLMTELAVAGKHTFFLSRLHIESIGAGGGSIGWVDDHDGTKSLKVGPMSAEADPGPVCYGKGGTRPTVTDANVVLGYVRPEDFLGGRMELDRQGAVDALGALGREFEMGHLEVAAGIRRIVDVHMATLVRKMTIERGHDPREFVLFAYGGGGPVHVGSFARELGISEVVIPMSAVAAVWSAYGAVVSDVRHVLYTALTEDFPPSLDRLNDAITAISAEASTRLTDSGIAPDQHDITLSLDMSFRAQVYAIDVPLDAVLMGRMKLIEADLEPLLAEFFEHYERTFGEGVAYRHGRVRVRGLRCVARGIIPKPPQVVSEAIGGVPTVLATRPVYWAELGEELATPAYDGLSVTVGTTIEGPATIGFPETTVVVAPGQTAHADELGNIRLRIHPEA